MALTTVDKIKINKYLKEHAIDDIYYVEICDILGKKDKVSYIEFLEYFTDYVINEFNKNEKISIKHISKVIFLIEALIKITKKSKIEIKEEIISKITSLKDYYKDYLERNELELDKEFNDNYINSVVNQASKLSSGENIKETIIKYINKFKELEDEIKKLEKQVEETTKNRDKLIKDNDKQIKKIDILNKNILSMEKEINDKNKKIEELNKELELLKTKITELEDILSHNKIEKEEISKYKEKCKELTEELQELKKILEEETKEKQHQENFKIRTTELEALIYKKLLHEEQTIDDIIVSLQKEGYNSTREEISNILKNIKTRISISNNKFSLSPVYKVNTPNIIEDDKFIINIPNNCKYYDIMLVSDFHIRNIDGKILTGFNMLYEYCTKNNINLILNLGDFYDGLGNKTIDYYNAIKNYNLIEQSISFLPKADNIYHAILGGNHDRNILKYGYDPIKILTTEREDFINLGYNHSSIYLNDDKDTLGIFDIHHPNSFDFSIELDDNGIDFEGLGRYLENIYQKQGRIRNDSYIDIFGHTHKNQFNYEKSYCYIPSFFELQAKRGACHLRIYFDDNKNIKYMVFMPLSVNNQLIKNNEIIYKKILTK